MRKMVTDKMCWMMVMVMMMAAVLQIYVIYIKTHPGSEFVGEDFSFSRRLHAAEADSKSRWRGCGVFQM